jgi:MFS family permease
VIAPRAGTLAAFRSRDFRLLWSGQTISFTGDAAFLVALGWRVTDLTGQVGTLGYVLALESIALLATLLLGGVLADRYPRQRLMIASDLARAVVTGAFLAVDLSGNLTLATVLVLAALFGLADGFFQPAFGGIVPLVVEAPMLPSANSWLGIAQQGSAIVGPAIAAVLYGTTGPSAVWALESASFLVSAAALALARPRRLEPVAPEGIWRELASGFRYVVSVPWIWTGIAAATVILMVAMAPFTALLPQVVLHHFDRGVGAYGLLFSAMAAGMVAGSLAWAKWHPRRHRIVVCFASFAVNDLGIIALATTPWFPVAVAAVVWRGAWIGVGIAAWTTLVTELVPENLLSRVFSFDYFGSLALTPVGYLLAGVLATQVAATTILAVGGTLGAILWLTPLVWRPVRTAA